MTTTTRILAATIALATAVSFSAAERIGAAVDVCEKREKVFASQNSLPESYK